MQNTVLVLKIKAGHLQDKHTHKAGDERSGKRKQKDGALKSEWRRRNEGVLRKKPMEKNLRPTQLWQYFMSPDFKLTRVLESWRRPWQRCAPTFQDCASGPGVNNRPWIRDHPEVLVDSEKLRYMNKITQQTFSPLKVAVNCTSSTGHDAPTVQWHQSWDSVAGWLKFGGSAAAVVPWTKLIFY